MAGSSRARSARESFLTNTGTGSLSPVIYEGNGLYGADLTAAAQAGSAAIQVTMTTGQGTASVPAAISVAFLGPPSPAGSEIGADPTRIPFDGVSLSTREREQGLFKRTERVDI